MKTWIDMLDEQIIYIYLNNGKFWDALISDLHCPPLYWMGTFRFLALNGLDMETIIQIHIVIV